MIEGFIHFSDDITRELNALEDEVDKIKGMFDEPSKFLISEKSHLSEHFRKKVKTVGDFPVLFFLVMLPKKTRKIEIPKICDTPVNISSDMLRQNAFPHSPPVFFCGCLKLPIDNLILIDANRLIDV